MAYVFILILPCDAVNASPVYDTAILPACLSVTLKTAERFELILWWMLLSPVTVFIIMSSMPIVERCCREEVPPFSWILCSPPRNWLEACPPHGHAHQF